MVGLVVNVYTNSLFTVPNINKHCLAINHFFSVYFYCISTVKSLMVCFNQYKYIHISSVS